VVLIAGGKDKGFGVYRTVNRMVTQKLPAVVVLGEMADRISDVEGPGEGRQCGWS